MCDDEWVIAVVDKDLLWLDDLLEHAVASQLLFKVEAGEVRRDARDKAATGYCGVTAFLYMSWASFFSRAGCITEYQLLVGVRF